MDKVTVKRSDLLTKLKENRDKHRSIFLEAIEEYRAQVIKELDAMLTEAKDGKRIRRQVGLVEPMDQTKEYDRAIKMLEMSIDDNIDISEHEFAQYVLDDWSWKLAWSGANIRYSKSLQEQN